MWLIQLYPFIYTRFCSENILLYNVQTKKYYILPSYDEIQILNRFSLILLDKYGDKSQLSITVKKETLGTVQKVDTLSQYILPNFDFRLAEYLDRFTKANWDNKFIKERYINKLVINLTNEFDLITGEIRTKGKEIMKAELLHSLWEKKFEFKNLIRISINTNYYALKENYSTISLMVDFCETTLNVPLNDFVNHVKDYLSIKCKIIILIMNLDGSTVNIVKDVIEKYNVQVCVFLNSMNDYNLLAYSDLLMCNNIIININSESRSLDFDNLLGYSIEDTFVHNPTLDKILQKEYFNLLYWGNAYIDYVGDVYINRNIPIGNITTWKDIDFCRFLDSNSLWKLIRRNFLPCNKCCFQNVCPPITIFEYITNKSYCLHKNIT